MKSLAEVHLHQKALAKEGIYVRAADVLSVFPKSPHSENPSYFTAIRTECRCIQRALSALCQQARCDRNISPQCQEVTI